MELTTENILEHASNCKIQTIYGKIKKGTKQCVIVADISWNDGKTYKYEIRLVYYSTRDNKIIVSKGLGFTDEEFNELISIINEMCEE